MSKTLHVKTKDTVVVLSGKDVGKQGKVFEVNVAKGTVLVENVNMASKHVKPSNANQQGGIIHQEAAINASNVMLVCPKCKKPARTGMKTLENGKKARYCKKCNEVINLVFDTKK